MFGDEFFGGFFGLALVFPLAFLAIIALAVVAVATGRAEPDPEGRRAYGFYLAAVGVVAVLVALFAVTDSAGSVISALVEEDESFGEPAFEEAPFFEGEGFSDEGFESVPPDFGGGEVDPDDERYANAVRSGLVAVAALAVYWFHRRRIDDVDEESKGREGPGWRVHYGYLLALAFLGVIVLLVAASDAAYGVFRAVAPGITGFGGDDDVERKAGLSQLLRSGILAAAGAFVFQHHWRRSQAIATPLPPEPPAAPTPPGGGGPAPASPPS